MIKYQVQISKDDDGFIAFFPDFLDYFKGKEEHCYAYGDDFFDVMISAEVALKVIFEFALQENKIDVLPEPTTSKSTDYYWVALEAQMAYPIFIRKARLQANLSQEDLAQKAKIPLQDLINIETYGQSNIPLLILQRIAQALQAQLDIKFIYQDERSHEKS